MSNRSELPLGTVVLVEHRLDTLVRADDALAIYAATSTVDGGAYTVAIAHDVAVQTASTALEAAIEKSGRHAVGIRGILPVLHARPVDRDGHACLGVVRRGAPHPPLAELLDGSTRTVSEVARMLSPIADALLALHDQGLAHGAVSSSTIVRRGADLALDFFGLSQAADAADGARGAAAALASGYRAAELSQSTPGPYSDVYALAVVAVELLQGAEHAAARTGDATSPTPRALGLVVSEAVEAAFEKALSSSPSKRPSPTGFLRELTIAASEPTGTATPPSTGTSTATVPASGAPTTPATADLAPTPPRPPRVVPAPLRSDDSSATLLGWGIAIGLFLFAAAMAGTAAFVLTRAPAPPASATPKVPVPLPPELSTDTATADPTAPPPPTLPVTPPRISTTPTYPADGTALLPVESDAIVRGDRDALLTLIVFGDLTDPFTARELALLPPLDAAYGGDLRVVFKHFPMPGRAEAEHASEALAVVQSRAGSAAAWKFVELATHGGELDAGRLEDLGIKAGLPAGAVTDGLRDHAGQKLVDRDVDLGRRLGVRGTPVLFFNGRRVDGIPNAEALRLFLDAEITRARKDLAKGTTRDALYATRVRLNVTTSEGERGPRDPR